MCQISIFCPSSPLAQFFIVALFWAAAIFNRLVLHSPSLSSDPLCKMLASKKVGRGGVGVRGGFHRDFPTHEKKLACFFL